MNNQKDPQIIGWHTYCYNYNRLKIIKETLISVTNKASMKEIRKS